MGEMHRRGLAELGGTNTRTMLGTVLAGAFGRMRAMYSMPEAEGSMGEEVEHQVQRCSISLDCLNGSSANGSSSRARIEKGPCA